MQTTNLVSGASSKTPVGSGVGDDEEGGRDDDSSVWTSVSAYEQKRGHFETRLFRRPNDRATLAAYADFLFEGGEHAKAVKMFERSIASGNDGRGMRLRLARTKMSLMRDALGEKCPEEENTIALPATVPSRPSEIRKGATSFGSGGGGERESAVGSAAVSVSGGGRGSAAAAEPAAAAAAAVCYAPPSQGSPFTLNEDTRRRRRHGKSTGRKRQLNRTHLKLGAKMEPRDERLEEAPPFLAMATAKKTAESARREFSLVLADTAEADNHPATLLEAAALESFCNRPKRARALLDAHLAFFPFGLIDNPHGEEEAESEKKVQDGDEDNSEFLAAVQGHAAWLAAVLATRTGNDSRAVELYELVLSNPPPTGPLQKKGKQKATGDAACSKLEPALLLPSSEETADDHLQDKEDTTAALKGTQTSLNSATVVAVSALPVIENIGEKPAASAMSSTSTPTTTDDAVSNRGNNDDGVGVPTESPSSSQEEASVYCQDDDVEAAPLTANGPVAGVWSLWLEKGRAHERLATTAAAARRQLVVLDAAQKGLARAEANLWAFRQFKVDAAAEAAVLTLHGAHRRAHADHAIELFSQQARDRQQQQQAQQELSSVAEVDDDGAGSSAPGSVAESAVAAADSAASLVPGDGGGAPRAASEGGFNAEEAVEADETPSSAVEITHESDVGIDKNEGVDNDGDGASMASADGAASIASTMTPNSTAGVVDSYVAHAASSSGFGGVGDSSSSLLSSRSAAETTAAAADPEIEALLASVEDLELQGADAHRVAQDDPETEAALERTIEAAQARLENAVTAPNVLVAFDPSQTPANRQYLSSSSLYSISSPPPPPALPYTLSSPAAACQSPEHSFFQKEGWRQWRSDGRTSANHPSAFTADPRYFGDNGGDFVPSSVAPDFQFQEYVLTFGKEVEVDVPPHLEEEILSPSRRGSDETRGESVAHSTSERSEQSECSARESSRMKGVISGGDRRRSSGAGRNGSTEDVNLMNQVTHRSVSSSSRQLSPRSSPGSGEEVNKGAHSDEKGGGGGEPIVTRAALDCGEEERRQRSLANHCFKTAFLSLTSDLKSAQEAVVSCEDDLALQRQSTLTKSTAVDALASAADVTAEGAAGGFAEGAAKSVVVSLTKDPLALDSDQASATAATVALPSKASIDALERDLVGHKASTAACLEWLGGHYFGRKEGGVASSDVDGSGVEEEMEEVESVSSGVNPVHSVIPAKATKDIHSSSSSSINATGVGCGDITSTAAIAFDGGWGLNGIAPEDDDVSGLWKKWVGDHSLWIKLARSHLGYWNGSKGTHKNKHSIHNMAIPQPVLCIDACSAALLRLMPAQSEELSPGAAASIVNNKITTTTTNPLSRQLEDGYDDKNNRASPLAMARAEARYMQALALSALSEVSAAVACAAMSLDDHPDSAATHRLILVGLTLALSEQKQEFHQSQNYIRDNRLLQAPPENVSFADFINTATISTAKASAAALSHLAATTSTKNQGRNTTDAEVVVGDTCDGHGSFHSSLPQTEQSHRKNKLASSMQPSYHVANQLDFFAESPSIAPDGTVKFDESAEDFFDSVFKTGHADTAGRNDGGRIAPVDFFEGSDNNLDNDGGGDASLVAADQQVESSQKHNIVHGEDVLVEQEGSYDSDENICRSEVEAWKFDFGRNGAYGPFYHGGGGGGSGGGGEDDDGKTTANEDSGFNLLQTGRVGDTNNTNNENNGSNDRSMVVQEFWELSNNNRQGEGDDPRPAMSQRGDRKRGMTEEGGREIGADVLSLIEDDLDGVGCGQRPPSWDPHALPPHPWALAHSLEAAAEAKREADEEAALAARGKLFKKSKQKTKKNGGKAANTHTSWSWMGPTIRSRSTDSSRSMAHSGLSVKEGSPAHASTFNSTTNVKLTPTTASSSAKSGTEFGDRSGGLSVGRGGSGGGVRGKNHRERQQPSPPLPRAVLAAAGKAALGNVPTSDLGTRRAQRLRHQRTLDHEEASAALAKLQERCRRLVLKDSVRARVEALCHRLAARTRWRRGAKRAILCTRSVAIIQAAWKAKVEWDAGAEVRRFVADNAAAEAWLDAQNRVGAYLLSLLCRVRLRRLFSLAEFCSRATSPLVRNAVAEAVALSAVTSEAGKGGGGGQGKGKGATTAAMSSTSLTATLLLTQEQQEQHQCQQQKQQEEEDQKHSSQLLLTQDVLLLPPDRDARSVAGVVRSSTLVVDALPPLSIFVHADVGAATALEAARLVRCLNLSERTAKSFFGEVDVDIEVGVEVAEPRSSFGGVRCGLAVSGGKEVGDYHAMEKAEGAKKDDGKDGEDGDGCVDYLKPRPRNQRDPRNPLVVVAKTISFHGKVVIPRRHRQQQGVKEEAEEEDTGGGDSNGDEFWQQGISVGLSVVGSDALVATAFGSRVTQRAKHAMMQQQHRCTELFKLQEQSSSCSQSENVALLENQHHAAGVAAAAATALEPQLLSLEELSTEPMMTKNDQDVLFGVPDGGSSSALVSGGGSCVVVVGGDNISNSNNKSSRGGGEDLNQSLWKPWFPSTCASGEVILAPWIGCLPSSLPTPSALPSSFSSSSSSSSLSPSSPSSLSSLSWALWSLAHRPRNVVVSSSTFTAASVRTLHLALRDHYAYCCAKVETHVGTNTKAAAEAAPVKGVDMVGRESALGALESLHLCCRSLSCHGLVELLELLLYPLHAWEVERWRGHGNRLTLKSQSDCSEKKQLQQQQQQQQKMRQQSHLESGSIGSQEEDSALVPYESKQREQEHSSVLTANDGQKKSKMTSMVGGQGGEQGEQGVGGVLVAAGGGVKASLVESTLQSSSSSSSSAPSPEMFPTRVDVAPPPRHPPTSFGSGGVRSFLDLQVNGQIRAATLHTLSLAGMSLHVDAMRCLGRALLVPGAVLSTLVLDGCSSYDFSSAAGTGAAVKPKRKRQSHDLARRYMYASNNKNVSGAVQPTSENTTTAGVGGDGGEEEEDDGSRRSQAAGSGGVVHSRLDNEQHQQQQPQQQQQQSNLDTAPPQTLLLPRRPPAQPWHYSKTKSSKSSSSKSSSASSTSAAFSKVVGALLPYVQRSHSLKTLSLRHFDPPLFGGFPGDDDAGDDGGGFGSGANRARKTTATDSGSKSSGALGKDFPFFHHKPVFFEHDGGALLQELCNCLYVNSSLQRLHLDGNAVGPGVAGLGALLRAANGRRKRCALQELGLANQRPRPISTPALQRLVDQSAGRYSLLMEPDAPGSVRDVASMGSSTSTSSSATPAFSPHTTTTITNRQHTTGGGSVSGGDYGGGSAAAGGVRRVLLVPIAHETPSSSSSTSTTSSAFGVNSTVRANFLSVEAEPPPVQSGNSTSDNSTAAKANGTNRSLSFDVPKTTPKILKQHRLRTPGAPSVLPSSSSSSLSSASPSPSPSSSHPASATESASPSFSQPTPLVGLEGECTKAQAARVAQRGRVSLPHEVDARLLPWGNDEAFQRAAADTLRNNHTRVLL